MGRGVVLLHEKDEGGEMELMTICSTCDGIGEVATQAGVEKCVRCDGRGKVPTQSGRELLEFLNTFADVIFHGWDLGEMGAQDDKPEGRVRGMTRRIDR